MKLILLSLFSIVSFAQATFTPGQGPQPAKPSVISIVLTTGATPCTLTGDTFPAKNIVFSGCVIGGVALPSFTIPSSVVLPWALTMQVNSGTSAQTFILSVTANNPFTIQVTVNQQPVVTGTF